MAKGFGLSNGSALKRFIRAARCIFATATAGEKKKERTISHTHTVDRGIAIDYDK